MSIEIQSGTCPRQHEQSKQNFADGFSVRRLRPNRRRTCYGHQEGETGDHDRPFYPNLLTERDITPPNPVWVADITYIRLLEGFIFLAVD